MREIRPTRKGRFHGCGDWREQYARKVTTMEEAVETIRDRDVIAVPGGGTFPQGFDAALGPYVRRMGYHVEVIAPYQLNIPKMLGEDYRENITFYSFFLGVERACYQRPGSNLQFIPVHLSQTGPCVQARRPRVIVMSCTPPDENGWMSRSVWGSHVHRDNFTSEGCQVVIAQVNRNLPYLHSDGERHLMLHVSEVDYIVEQDFTWPEIKARPSTDVEKAIAGFAAELIEDGACLQLGFGGLADAVGKNLLYAGRKDLGLQTEVLSNCVADLMRQGVINNSRKQSYRGRSVAGAIVGDRDLWAFCDHNPDICMKDIDWINEPVNVARNDNVVSINNAMEIDLTGQVASESMGSRQYTGTGGQLDWVLGAQMSRGGKSIIAITSTYRDRNGTLCSKIKPVLPLGSIVTTPRTCVQYVITEYGVANLRYKSVLERGRALIAIAHPDFRAGLARELDRLLF